MLAVVQKEESDISKELDATTKMWQRADDDVRFARVALATLDKQLDTLEDDWHRMDKQPNPHGKAVADRAAERTRLQARARALEDELDDLQRHRLIYEYWVKAFKDIRLQEIATALEDLQIEANNSVAELGLSDWELHFQVDKETKAGTIQRGFDVLIRSPHNKQAVPWEAWSGGESQRLRLAATMGLSDLIRAHCGAGSIMNLEVWDEPTNGLSPKGTADLLQALADRAQRLGRVIWVVDHRAHAFGGFAGHALVTKTKRGSIIEQDKV